MARLYNKTCFAVLIIVISLSSSVSLPFCKECAPFIELVAYWPMTFETKNSDMSGNDNHARFVGLTYTDGPNGEPKGAVHFNGSNSSFASVKNSPSMHLGKYPGFSFSGFVRYLGIQNQFASLIDWSSINGYGVFIVATPGGMGIRLQLHPDHNVSKQNAEFPGYINRKWHFIGLSYENATRTTTTFINGTHVVKPLKKHVNAGTGKTIEIGLGIDLSNMEFNYRGDMSCMMLFKSVLTAEEFEKVWEFCKTKNSVQATPSLVVESNLIIFSEITATSAKVSWKVVTGDFDSYSVDISPATKGAKANPSIVPKGTTITSLEKLSPGSYYTIKIRTKIDSRTIETTSHSFQTLELAQVESESIRFTNITVNSANVSWDEVSGEFETYLVDVSPIVGEAKADPSTVRRGTTTTTLKNLSPGTPYIVTIRTKVGLKTSSLALRSFHTLVLPKTDPPIPWNYVIPSVTIGVVITLGVIFSIIFFKSKKKNYPCNRGDANNGGENQPVSGTRSSVTNDDSGDDSNNTGDADPLLGVDNQPVSGTRSSVTIDDSGDDSNGQGVADSRIDDETEL